METFLKNFTDPSIEMDEDCTLKVKFDAAREVEFRYPFWDSFLFSAYRGGDRYGAIYGYAFIYFSCLGHWSRFCYPCLWCQSVLLLQMPLLFFFSPAHLLLLLKCFFLC